MHLGPPQGATAQDLGAGILVTIGDDPTSVDVPTLLAVRDCFDAELRGQRLPDNAKSGGHTPP
jgi:hypothetical protein